MGRVIPAFTQYFLDDGTPAVNGWLKFLESGTNNTLKNTYYDPTYQIPNANPLQLDGAGRCPDVFGTGKYRIISYINDPEDEDSPGEQIQTFDPVTAQVESIESGGAGSFGLWDAAEEYSYGDIVTHSLVYYRSLADGNLGNLPPDTPEKWERVDFLRWWNETISYTAGDLVYYDDNLYLSEQDINQNHQPDTSPAWWRPVATGYIEFSSYDEDYTVLPVDRDRILALDPAATTDRTFTLPAGDATTDQYRYAFYNCSPTYTLTIHAPGSALLWIDGSDITIDHGALLEIIYCAEQDQWFPMSNAGPVLGGQDIGTLTTPVNNLHLVNLYLDHADITQLHIPSNNYAFFGDSDQAQIGYVSATPALIADITAGGSYEWYVDSVLAWEMATTGELLPGPSNPNPNIGSTTAPIGAFYTATGFLPDDGAIAFGNDDDLQIWHSGSQANIYNLTGNSVYTTTGSSGHYFVTSVGNAMVIDSAGGISLGGAGFLTDVHIDGSLYLGSTDALRIFHSGSNGAIYNYTGNFYINTGATPTLAITVDTSQQTTFHANTYLSDGYRLFLNASQFASLYYSGGTYLGSGTATALTFYTSNVNRWIISSAGTFYPAATASYDIGGASNRAATIYANALNSTYLASPGDLYLGVDGSTTAKAIQITDISVTYITTPIVGYTFRVEWYCNGIGPYEYEDTIAA